MLDRELAGLGIEPGQPARLRHRAPPATWRWRRRSRPGVADVGVASEPAALAYGLAFVPLTQERFDLVIPAAQAGSREVQALLRVLSSPWLLDQLASLPGYDAVALRRARRHGRRPARPAPAAACCATGPSRRASSGRPYAVDEHARRRPGARGTMAG